MTRQQGYEAAYRLVARYYDSERIVPILRLLDAMSSTGDQSAMWALCVQETLEGAPLPGLPPPWDD